MAKTIKNATFVSRNKKYIKRHKKDKKAITHDGIFMKREQLGGRGQ